MIVRTAHGGNMEIRSTPDWVPGATIPPPALDWFGTGYFGNYDTVSGTPVTLNRALGLPVVLDAIRLLSETIASLPLNVCRGQGADKRMLDQSWQWQLLHWRPNPDQSAFDFWQDVAGCIESTGNAFIDKYRDVPGSPQLDALWVIDPGLVKIKRDERTNEKRFQVYGRHGGTSEFGTDRILHIRGFAPKGGDWGLSPINAIKHTAGTALARNEFEGRFYQNNTAVGGVLSFDADMPRQRATEILHVWEQTHGGAMNAGRPAVLGGGGKWQPYGMSMEDAQFIDAAKFTVEEIARAFNVPLTLLNRQEFREDIEQESRRFMNFSLGNRLRRIELALKADPDLFGVTKTLYPEFYVDDFIRPDAATRAEIRHKELQTGVLLVDEARAEKGLPPLKDGLGQIPQIVPVGGSPFGVPAATGNGNGNANAANKAE